MSMNDNSLQDILPPRNYCDVHTLSICAVDASGSMSAVSKNGIAAIDEANNGLEIFGNILKSDKVSKNSVDVCVLSFSGDDVKTEIGFRPASEYKAPVLSASGGTPFNKMLNTSLDMIGDQKMEYRKRGINYTRPLFYVVTDGYPTDPELTAETRIRMQEAIRHKHVQYIPVAVGDDADEELLRSYYPEEAENKPVLHTEAEALTNAFDWFSSSLVEISNSEVGTDTVQSPPLPSTLTLSLK